jgi:hypothetical protein
MLYRKDKSKTVDGRKQAQKSGEIGKMWKAEPEEVQAEYVRCAEIGKAEHTVNFPGYKY